MSKKRADDNNAPRHKVTVQKLKDQAGHDVVGGAVEVTFPGQVKLFDAKTDGNAVLSGVKFDQANLPVELYVQGEAYSSTMRDVKLTATPVGHIAGKDDVSFTVLWVGMDSIASEGSNVSANNDKIIHYRLSMIDGGTKLGPVYVSHETMAGGFRWSNEAKGLVYPNNFSYPGSDLRLDRDVPGPFLDSHYEMPTNAWA